MSTVVSTRIKAALGVVAVSICLVAMSGVAWAGHGGGQTKVTICHKGHTITVGAPALKAHRRHGDTLGACASACQDACPKLFDPVDCSDGKTYNNTCLAQCAGQSQCQSPCACPKIIDPVTCGDGNSTATSAWRSAPVRPSASRRRNRACPKTFDPVTCGDQVFGNECLAECERPRPTAIARARARTSTIR